MPECPGGGHFSSLEDHFHYPVGHFSSLEDHFHYPADHFSSLEDHFHYPAGHFFFLHDSRLDWGTWYPPDRFRHEDTPLFSVMFPEMLKQEHQDFLLERMDEANQNKTKKTPGSLSAQKFVAFLCGISSIFASSSHCRLTVCPSGTACHQRMTSDEQQAFFFVWAHVPLTHTRRVT